MKGIFYIILTNELFDKKIYKIGTTKKILINFQK